MIRKLIDRIGKTKKKLLLKKLITHFIAFFYHHYSYSFQFYSLLLLSFQICTYSLFNFYCIIVDNDSWMRVERESFNILKKEKNFKF